VDVWAAIVKPYYQDDLATIYHGDALDILPSIEADVLVTDPPYGIAYKSNMAGRFKGRSIAADATVEARDVVLSWHAGKPAIVFGSWKAERPAGIRALLIWDKGDATGMGDLSLPWKPNHEDIYIIGDGFAGRRTTGVLRYSIGNGSSLEGKSPPRMHPTEKPVDLLRDLIAKCPPGVIVDPFMGSGSTLRAAKDLGRTCIGIEVSEEYCEGAARRLAQDNLFHDSPTTSLGGS
jgi:site-specific DNA-methyltransferase (adenine-specific)